MKIANPIGKKGEDVATEYLQKKGYTIIERNFRKKYTEIDIIAVHNGILVFIEVKTRSSKTFGSPIEGISKFKLKSLMYTAILYKQLHPLLPEGLRIDAVVILLSKNQEILKIEHIENITD